MAQTHVQSGERVSVLPLGEGLGGATTTALLKADQLEIVRIVLREGAEMREHKAPGEITLQCIEGLLELRTPGTTRELAPGDLVHLRRNEAHSLKALKACSALLTMCLPLT
jgi:quercetin dioxygenase-like cupin family protein